MIRAIAIKCLFHRLWQMNGKSHGGFLEFKAFLESPTIVLAFREVFRLGRNRRKPYFNAWQGLTFGAIRSAEPRYVAYGLPMPRSGL